MMSEARDRVIKRIAIKYWGCLSLRDAIRDNPKNIPDFTEDDFDKIFTDKKPYYNFAKHLLVENPEIAIVDREAELPTIPDPPIYSDKPYSDIEKQAFRVGTLTYRNSVVKAGWIKEVNYVSK